MSSHCPTDTNLRLFLDEQLESSKLHQQIVDHLESCKDCQQKIESFLDELSVESATQSEPIGSSLNEDSVEELIDRLSATPPSRPSIQSSLSGTRLGVYNLLEIVGHGTAGVVYRAEDTRLKRFVAVKVLRNDFTNSNRTRERLEREARATASLKQQNIVGVHDIHVDPIGVSYLVMEYIEGGTLKNRIKEQGAIDSREAAEIAQQILFGLECAHQHGLVHRDLKSSNVLLKAQGSDDVFAKITDFGLVRDLESDSNLTRENVIAGTPAYMSPEQVLAPHDVDHRADVYSMGIVLYEMLSGELPFRGIDKMVLKQVVHDEPKLLCRQNDSISRDLETVCLKAISKNPESRYATASEMRIDIERWMAGKPILARRVGPLYRAWNWSRRNPMVASLLGIVFGLLTLLAVGSNISALSLSKANQEAKRQAAAAALQRDQSLETIRKLVFEVNELLEPGMVTDLDKAQMKLLQVALKGIEQIERTGNEAGLSDVSTVVAKNRLGDVYYRMDWLDEANDQFKEAIRLADTVQFDGNQKLLLEERLRAYEGLVSYAIDSEYQESEVNELIDLANNAASQLSDVTGEEVVPQYYSTYEGLLNDFESQLAEAMQSSPAELEALEQAVSVVAILGGQYLDKGMCDESSACFQKYLDWLNQADVEASSREVSRAINTGKFVALQGLGAAAFFENDTKEYEEFLRRSIDALPRESDEKKFHSSIEDLAAYSADELTEFLFDTPLEHWMIEYFTYDVELKEASIDYGGDKFSLCTWLISKARLVNVCFQAGEVEKSKLLWSELKTELEESGVSQFRSRYTRDLDSELAKLKKLGFE